MCSLTISQVLKEQLDDLGNQGEKVLIQLKRRAFDASALNMGLLDAPDTNLRNPFPPDLRTAGVRKVTIMRHRVYFTGRHVDCNYFAFYVKAFKKGDEPARDDNNPRFQNRIRKALESPPIELSQEST